MSVKKGSVYVSNSELIRRVAYQRASGLTQIAWIKYIKVKDVNQIGRAMAQLKARGVSRDDVDDQIQIWIDDIRLFLDSKPADRDEFLMWYEEIIRLGLNAQETSAGLIKFLDKNDINNDWYFNMLRGYEFYRYCLSIMSPADAAATMNSGIDGPITLCFNHPKGDAYEGDEKEDGEGGKGVQCAATAEYMVPVNAAEEEPPSSVTAAAVGYMDEEEEASGDEDKEERPGFISVYFCRYKSDDAVDRSASITMPYVREKFADIMGAIDIIVRKFMAEE